MKTNTRDKIHNNFLRALFANKNGERILNALLTKTEKIMLAKRLAIIVMLEYEHSHYGIVRTLKISPSTPRRYARLSQTGIFAPIQHMLNNKRSRRSLLDIIELLLAAGMPSIAGPRGTKRLQRLRKGQ
jgi:hypothetical protein